MNIEIKTEKKITKHLPYNEYLKVFPEAIDYIFQRLVYLHDKRQRLLDKFKTLLKGKELNLTEIILLRDTFKERLEKISKEIIRLESYFTCFDNNPTFIDVKAIKEEVDIIDVFKTLYPDVKLYKTSKSLYCLCPFHKEGNPSFHLYPITRAFFCFGCGVKGDVIDLIRFSLNLGFKQAVNYLLTNYISKGGGNDK